MVQRSRALEGVVIDHAFWSGRRVLLTGHTGFKGAWTALLLHRLGAHVEGFALEPEDSRGLFVAARLAEVVRHRVGDLRDLGTVSAALAESRPHIVIHMAAQALVRASYRDPVTTYATNVMGTVHVLEAVRRTPGVEAVLIVTSDKCYANDGSLWGFREPDAMGGHDPYSNSKGCAELVTDAYRRSFFGETAAPRIASARAGNVIGGGDWSADRLVPDAVRAFSTGETLRVRHPGAVRPWQHVLDPVLGYLTLCQRMVADGHAMAGGWNFGPSPASEIPVATVLDSLIRLWGPDARWDLDEGMHPAEAHHLRLDCAKARALLGWTPRIDLDTGLRLTVDWYREQARGADIRDVTLSQIEHVLQQIAVRAASAA